MITFCKGRRLRDPLTKLLRIMRITAFILLVCSLHVTAKSVSQTITLKGKDISLLTIFSEIEKQSGYVVFYNRELIAHSQPISVDVKDEPLLEFLDETLMTIGLAYDLKDKTIVIKKSLAADLSPRLQKKTPPTLPISGVVKGVDGKPLANVSVTVKGTEKGTTTDDEGRFNIDVNPGEVLVVSSVGFGSKEVKVNTANSSLVIALDISSSPLDEVQIIAYGETSRRLNTGSVTTIKAADIEKQPVNNPLYALQGRVPGLQVTPTTGLAGGGVNIQIRGKNSLNYSSDPLIVVDGLPIVNNIAGLGHVNLQQLSSLSFINPNDIASIEVLKDADATSIYGSRGANGIILITTKKGKPGKTSVEVNLQTGWADVAQKLELLNTQQYLELRKEAYTNAGIDFINTFPYGDPVYTDFVAPDLFVWDTTRYTDWQKELIGGTANYNELQVGISGGTSLVRYQLRGNYHKETTVFPGSNSDTKGNTFFSLSGESPNHKLNSTITASYLADRNTLPGIDYTYESLTLAPNAPRPYQADGILNWEPMASGASSWNNPFAQLLKSYDAKIKNLMASALVSYEILPSLSLKTQLGFSELRGSAFTKVEPFAAKKPEDMSTTQGGSSFSTSYVTNRSVEPQISYERHISRGKLNVLAGGSYQSTDAESQLLFAYGFTNDALLSNLAAATTLWATNTSSQYRYTAIFGRLHYNWENKYLLSMNARRDGSSRFGPGNQFGNFGSLGAAWIFTEEKFSSRINHIVTFGKLRFSYGSSGNDGIGDYRYLERYEPITGLDPYQGATGYRSTGLFNAYFGWEVTNKMEFGLEAGLLKDRILLNVNYFRNRSNNQLLSYPAPSMAGPGSLIYNMPALIQNTGIELMLETENMKSGHFRWSTSVNLTRNRNKLVSYPNIENSALYTVEIGQPFTGVERVYNSQGVDPATGLYQFVDLQGKPTLSPEDPTRVDGGRYLRVMTSPNFFGGLSNTFSFKGFTLDILFQFTKQKGTNPLSPYLLIAGVAVRNLPVEYLTRWRSAGDVSGVQKVYGVPDDNLIRASDRLVQSSWNYVDASFIRLKNASLYYSIPAEWKQRLRMNDVRIFIQGQNLWTITKYKGLDPEMRSIGELPPLRVITVGANIVL